MKAKLGIVLLWVMVFSVFSVLDVPAIFSNRPGIADSVALSQETVPASVEAINPGSAGSISLTGSIVISGNNVVRFGGVSPSMRARVFLNGSIDVRDNGLLILEYVVLYLVGAKKDYDRYIRLSAPSAGGRPRMVVTNASVVAYTTAYVSGQSVSYACLIDLRGNSAVTGKEFAFYRGSVGPSATIGKRPVINCSDDSSISVSYGFADSIRVFGNARVSISMGAGPKKARTGDDGVAFDVHDTSSVNLYGVNFTDTLVADSASMALVWCREMSSSVFKAKGSATVSISAKSDLNGGISRAGLWAMGNSTVALNSSEVSPSLKTWYSVNVTDNAVFSAYNSTIVSRVIVRGSSSVSISKMRRLDIKIPLYVTIRDSASVALSNCLLGSSNFVPEINVYDNARFSFAGSSFWWGGLLRFSNSSSGVFTSSSLSACLFSMSGSANVTLTRGCKVGNLFEMRDNASLQVVSSSVPVVLSLNTARISLYNSTASFVQAKDDSKIFANNSTIKELLFTAANVSGFWGGLTRYFQNMSLTMSGLSPDVVLVNSYVNAIDVLFFGNSNVTVRDSALNNVGVQGTSVLKLFNVTYVSEDISVTGKARVYVNSTLRVRVVDYFGNPLSGANVSVYRGVGSLNLPLRMGSKLTDGNGWASFVFYSGFFNASGRFMFGDITVYSVISGVSGAYETKLTGENLDVTLSLSLPGWTRYILPLVVIVVLIVAVFGIQFVYGKVRRKEK